MERKANYSYELNDVITYMVDDLGVEYPTDIYTSDYLIVSILDRKRCRANILLDNYLMSDNMSELRSIYVAHIVEKIKPNFKHNNDDEIIFSDILKDILSMAELEMDKTNSDKVGSEHVLLAMINPKNGFSANEVFYSMNVKYDNILRKCQSYSDEKKKRTSGLINNNGGATKGGVNVIAMANTSEYIKKYTVNISERAMNGEYEPLIGRKNEIGQIIKVFSRKRKNNVILVGESGVGKTHIVRGLAQVINSGDVPPLLMNKEIVMLDIMALVSGTNFRGMMEERIDSLFKELKRNKKYILLLDDIQTMLRSGTKEKDTDISGMLQPVLSNGDIQIIATTSEKDYRNTVEINGALSRKFQKIVVEPNTKEETLDILDGCKGSYEAYHGVKFSRETLKKVISLSERYINDSCLPDSAFDVMDSVGAYVSIRSKREFDMADLRKRLEEINDKKIKALSEGNFEAIESINDEETLIERDMERKQNEMNGMDAVQVTDDDVALVVGEMTNIPMSRLNSYDKKNLVNIEEKIKSVVIGQDEAVSEACKCIKRNRVGLEYKTATYGSLLCLGVPGVGKTYFAKTLAKEIFGDEKALVRIDMSEYSEKSSVSKLIGSNPGYVGFENGGQLTEAVKHKPYCVILLDEIEKADPEIYNVFLQLFDEGRLTDSAGKTVSFKNCIVIMTSNIGVKQSSELGAGIGFETDEGLNKRSIIEKELKRRFSPEFLNRIDKVLYFNPLSDDNLRKVVRLEINKFTSKLREMKYDFKFDDGVVEYIYKLTRNQDESGARPIIRLIRDNIEDWVTDMLLQNDYEDGHVFVATCENDSIKIS